MIPNKHSTVKTRGKNASICEQTRTNRPTVFNEHNLSTNNYDNDNDKKIGSENQRADKARPKQEDIGKR